MVIDMLISKQQSLVINPAAGNEPIILGARIGLAINDVCIAQGKEPLNIIILSSGERQKRVLQDELTGLSGTERILLDERGGSLLATVLSSQGNFAEHMRVLHDEYSATQTALNDRLGKQATQPFATHNLTGQEVTVDPQSILGSIDTGGRVIIDTHYRDFAFPVLTSELIRAAHMSDDPMIAAVEARARAEDLLYRDRFIPLVYTLTGPAISEDPTIPMREKFKELLAQPATTQGGEIIFTPPMKNMSQPAAFDGVTGEGVYAMLSGHGPGVDDTFRATLRAASDAGLKVYTNPWSDEVEGTIRISPKALYDPRIKTVVGRAGWGTGWLMLNIGKPWLVIPVQPGDDPEIRLNHQVITRLGIGAVIDPESFAASDLEGCIHQFSPRVRALRDLTTEHFGTSDGVAYIAQRIAANYLAV
jgi:hypothetical protein